MPDTALPSLLSTRGEGGCHILHMVLYLCGVDEGRLWRCERPTLVPHWEIGTCMCRRPCKLPCIFLLPLVLCGTVNRLPATSAISIALTAYTHSFSLEVVRLQMYRPEVCSRVIYYHDFSDGICVRTAACECANSHKRHCGKCQRICRSALYYSLLNKGFVVSDYTITVESSGRSTTSQAPVYAWTRLDAYCATKLQ